MCFSECFTLAVYFSFLLFKSVQGWCFSFQLWKLDPPDTNMCVPLEIKDHQNDNHQSSFYIMLPLGT